MSPKLKLLQRQMERQTPERIPVAPASNDLAAAIERLVQERVDAALEQQPVKPPPHVRRLMDDFNRPEPVSDYRQLPAVQKTAPKNPLSMIIHRDGADKILWVETSDGLKVEMVRDGAGKAIAMREITESPVLPELDIAYKTEAREYQPGTPRKLYGNDEVK
ncbi:hypothetical protein [Pseudomonas putida]|uniref:hypothetical protein n=1 Tax=Pseudomonas putida TaxID=303 RepID=UPI003D97D3BC